MKGEEDGKRCAKLSITLDLDPAAVLFHNLLTNSQTEAGARLTRIAACFATVEALEQMSSVFRRDRWTIVVNTEG